MSADKQNQTHADKEMTPEMSDIHEMSFEEVEANAAEIDDTREDFEKIIDELPNNQGGMSSEELQKFFGVDKKQAFLIHACYASSYECTCQKCGEKTGMKPDRKQKPDLLEHNCVTGTCMNCGAERYVALPNLFDYDDDEVRILHGNMTDLED